MDVFWTIFLFALGACMGSFLNVVIYRLPRGQSIVFPGSRCPHCGRAIAWHDNIPIVSWLVLHGRCRHCRAPISPRYLGVEIGAGVLLAGLYVLYYPLRVRTEPAALAPLAETWPTYAAHAALLCGLLACSLVDIEQWIVPLEVCWFVALAGVAAATAAPGPWMQPAGLGIGAAALAAPLGLLVSLLLLHYGVLPRSFLDARDTPAPAVPARPPKNAGGSKRAAKSRRKSGAASRPTAVAVTKAHGVDPRREMVWEVLFLLPAVALAVAAWVLVTHAPAVRAAWRAVNDPAQVGALARHVGGLQAAVLGYLVGGAWVWGMRILGTLGFGKEAMGMGDVHILAAVGAVTGVFVPSVAFFLAPVFALLWALYLYAGRGQRELPYGPWLAVASAAVMILYDPIWVLLEPYRRLLAGP